MQEIPLIDKEIDEFMLALGIGQKIINTDKDFMKYFKIEFYNDT